MRDLDHARLMLSLARDELNALEVMLETALVTPAIFGFHAQQAVEKSLKAWLSLLGREYPLTHNLLELFCLVEDTADGTPCEFRDLHKLTPFAVRFRYEDLDSGGMRIDRQGILERVRRFYLHVDHLVESASS